MKQFSLATLISSLILVFSSYAATITEFNTSSAASNPFGVIQGPDGNMWVTQYTGNKIAKVTADGTVTEYAVSGGPVGITVGPDNNLWFTEYTGNKIAKMSTAGVVLAEYSLPVAGVFPRSIVKGADGNLWFTEVSGNKIGKITTDGVITEYATLSAGPRGITLGSDGNIWYTTDANAIGKMTTAGVATEYTVPSATSNPRNIISGNDGAMWFSEQAGNKIGRVTTSGIFSEYTIPTSASAPSGLVNGPSGTGIWFVEGVGKKIGHISPDGTIISEIATPSITGQPEEITMDSSGNLWYTEYGSGKIGKIVLASTDVVSITTSSGLSAGITGTSYSQTLAATSGTTPYYYFLKSGTLPAGLLLSYDGKIGGTPTASGTYNFTIQLFDDNSISTTKDFSIVITDPIAELSGSYTSFKRTRNTMDAKFKITNTGNKTAGASRVTFYVSNDATRGAGDAKIVISKVNILDAGASQTIKIRFSRNSLKKKYLIAQIDSASKVDESDETNNDVAKKIS